MLRFRQVSKRFGSQQVLDALDLELDLTGVTFVMGPSGAGKSVLAQLAVGLLRPDAGQIELLGRRIDDLPERKLRSARAELAYLAQGPALLDWLTLRENVALGPTRARRVSPAEADALAEVSLREVGLLEQAERLPGEVGPGVQKRVAVARALACRPRALVYDEPTTGLDPRSARQVDDLVAASASRGMAAVVVTHDLVSVRRLGGRVVVLGQGRVGYDGPALALFQSDAPAVRALLGAGA